MASEASEALSEGRRIYLGNIPYTVKPWDIETMLEVNGFEKYEKIHISIDPVSGKNPGYCFIEFSSRDDTDRALSSLVGVTIRGRPLKVGPCRPKPAYQGRKGRLDTEDSPTFQRWGDWRGDMQEAKEVEQGPEQGPYGALQHLYEMVTHDHDGRRLYVGGLGKMINQVQHNVEVRQLFDDFDIVAIGKRITPHPSSRAKPGNHHYCFVDFSSAEEAKAAMIALNGKQVPGGTLRVSVARGIPQKLKERITTSKDELYETEQPSVNDSPNGNQNGVTSRNWRTVDKSSFDVEQLSDAPNGTQKSITARNWRASTDMDSFGLEQHTISKSREEKQRAIGSENWRRIDDDQSR